jgi:sterol 14-demethylase
MINDVQTVLNKLGDEAPGIIDPFEDLGHIVALMTMRAIGCDDIADDPILLEKSVYWYLVIKNSATPMVRK